MRELYVPATGRWARIDADALARLEADPDHPEAAPLRRRLADLGYLGDPDLTAWIPCRHHRVLLLPDVGALWVPVPGSRTAGGYPYRALPLTDDDLALWRQLNEARTVRQVAAAVGRSAADVLATLAGWTARDVQAVQLRPRPPRPTDPGLQVLCAPERPPGARVPGQTLREYHLNGITDGSTHFDDRETTVAHALAAPHPALGGQPYGTRLRQALSARGWATGGPVVEVGCGDGELARDWAPSGPYLRVDLSPVLLATQATTAPGTSGVLADALALPLADASVPLLLCNEVVADLPSVPGPAGYANVGAWAFVAQVARVLAPGGRAVLTEFGDPEDAPAEAVQLDHGEVAIHFGLLAHIARTLGLHTELVRLDDLLDADLHAPQLSRASWAAVRARLAALGARLPTRAWTPETLAEALPFEVEGLRWTTVASDGPGPRITRFWALLLHRP